MKAAIYARVAGYAEATRDDLVTTFRAEGASDADLSPGYLTWDVDEAFVTELPARVRAHCQKLPFMSVRGATTMEVGLLILDYVIRNAPKK